VTLYFLDRSPATLSRSTGEGRGEGVCVAHLLTPQSSRGKNVSIPLPSGNPLVKLKLGEDLGQRGLAMLTADTHDVSTIAMQAMEAATDAQVIGE
jgi:hypothetical protein